MIVKVCGIRDPGNANRLAELQIDMMGMIYYSKSPRYVGGVARELFSEPSVSRVGVFVNADFKEIANAVERDNLDYVQLHGNESADLCNDLQKITKVIKVFRVGADFDFSATREFEFCELFLFETFTQDYGGSGKKFDWAQLDLYKGTTQFLLSGGIGPQDAVLIKRINHPWFYGIDLNSRFETEPGLKNIQALKTFIDELSS